MAEYARYHDPERNAVFAEAMRLRMLTQTYMGDQALAERTAQMYSTWPQMRPGTVYAMAQAGVNPMEPLAQQVARTSQRVKAKRGFFTKIGDVVTAGTGRLGEGLDILGGGISTGVRGVTRGALTAVSAPFEEAQGALRSLAGTIGGRPGGLAAGAAGGAALGSVVPGVGTAIGAVVGGGIGGVLGFLAGDKIESEDPGFRFQSTLAQAVGQLQEKGDIDLGSGFLPGGTAREEQQRRATEAASIAGKGITIGRLSSAAVFEPGSKPYDIMSGLVDTAAILRLDPTVRAGMKSSQIRAARKTILPEKADDFITSVPGQQLMEGLAAERNAFTIWRMSKGQIPVDVAVRISNARTANEVTNLIRPELGHAVTQKFKPQVLRRVDTPRLLTDMPVGKLEWDRPNEFIQKVDDFMKLARVLPEDRLHHADQIMRALAGGRGSRQPAVLELQNMMAETIHSLSQSRVPGIGRTLPKSEAQRLSKLIGKTHDDLRNYTAAETAMDSRIPAFHVNGRGQRIPAPQLISEMLDNPIPLPSFQDLRAIRQEINGVIGPLLRTPGIGKVMHGSDAFASWTMSRVWKPSVLLRGALTVRTVGEEQIRMAGAGYDSFFSHPMSYISRLLAGEAPEGAGRIRRGAAAVGRAGERAGLPVERGRTGLGADVLSDAVDGQRALVQAQQRADFAEAGLGKLTRTGHKIRYSAGEEGFKRGWLEHELGHLRADPVAQHYAQNGADATKDWLWSGGGRKFLNDLRTNRPGDPHFMANRADVDLYIDGVVGKRIKDFTQDDERLLKFIGKGRKEGGIGRDAHPADVKAQKEAGKVIDELIESGRSPEAAVGDLAFQARKGGSDHYDEGVTWLFGQLLGRPTNFLNRSRVFEQEYWRGAEDMVTALTPKAQQTALANARKAKLSREQIGRLEQRITEGSGQLSIKQVDTALKAKSLDKVQELLYDLSRRGQGADAVRLIMPFAEPWKEMTTTWARLLYQRPHLARRAQTIVEGARGAGVFHVDEQTGEEMFAYPFTEFVTKAVTGVPIPLGGRVAGLNLFADNPIMPGFGPLVQIPAAALIPDKPQFDWVQGVLNPLGPREEGFLEQIVFPAAWMNKVRLALSDPESDRLFNNAVFDIARYYHSTGEYPIDTQDGQELLTRKSISTARSLYLLRAVASFGAPSAPQLKFLSGIKDPEQSGRLMTQFKLMETFREYQDEDYDTAVERFLTDFGEDALLFMQPKTKGGAPAEEAMLDFARENSELANRYPETWHFFGPRGGEFSYAAYVRQIRKGEREVLNIRDLEKLGNNRVAALRWSKAKETVGDRPNQMQREWLDKVKTELLQKYPGFEPMPRDIGRGFRQIQELQQAVSDPKLANTQVGIGLKSYFRVRDQAIEAAQNAGLRDHTQSVKMVAVRNWLRNAADKISDSIPEFQPLWDQILRRELKDDDPADMEQELG